MTPRQVVDRYLVQVLGGAAPASVDQVLANEQLRRRTESFRRAFPDLEIETQVVLAERELVAAHMIGRGTHLGLFQGVPPTGGSWEARCTAVYRVEREHIVDAWVSWDTLSLLEQLGAVERVSTVSA